MINKYSGIGIILLAIVSLVASWTMYKKQTKNFYAPTRNTLDSQQLIRNIEIKPEAFESLQVMNDVVAKLSQSRTTSGNNISIAMSPFANKEKRPLVAALTEKDKQRRMARRICQQAKRLNVTMSFVTQEDKYAVIADKFVREGQIVGNKYKVMSITTGKVKLRKRGVSCTVKVSGTKKIVAQI
ncbi:MAG: hypothetical protein L3J83_00325 [Proteobacteria bacterium]|nr:hypothetical protein [Pseudomonadota bacterium]